MIESGEKERLKELLRERLVEYGWIDEMKSLCRFLLFILTYIINIIIVFMDYLSENFYLASPVWVKKILFLSYLIVDEYLNSKIRTYRSNYSMD